MLPNGGTSSVVLERHEYGVSPATESLEGTTAQGMLDDKGFAASIQQLLQLQNEPSRALLGISETRKLASWSITRRKMEA